MSGYKLVPVEPTAEMLEAYQESSSWTAPFSTWGYKAMLATAPAVQGEPVLYVAKDAIEDSEVVGMHAVRRPNGLHNFPLYTAPQPAVQGEPVAGEVTLFECVDCNYLYQSQVSRCDCMPAEQKFNRWLARPERTAPQPTERQPTRRKTPMSYPNGLDMESMPGMVESRSGHQQPGPDVAGLVEALDILGNVRHWDSAKWESALPRIDAILATHRKGGE